MRRSVSGRARIAGTMTALLMGVCAASARPAGAQAVRLGVVMDLPRQTLENLWTDDAHQTERAYCVTDWSYGVYHVSRTKPVQDDTVFRVFEIREAETDAATPISAEFQCPEGMPELHVHTPTTCMGDDVNTCVAGGLNAFSCQPSRGDLEKIVQRHDEFAVIQCDKRVFRFYYPSDYGPAPPDYASAKSDIRREAGNLTPAMKPDEQLGPPQTDPGSGSRVKP